MTTTQKTEAIDLWKEKIGVEPVHNTAKVDKVNKAWENMGQAFGKIQVEKLKYQKAGMTQVVQEIDTKWKDEVKTLESKTLELMGYPVLDNDLKSKLLEKARGDGLYLNTYKLEEYKKIPPVNISDAILEAKQYFPNIEVWAIEETAYVRPVKDPAVVGYVNGKYYLIATWGDDITTEDLGLTVIKELEDTP